MKLLRLLLVIGCAVLAVAACNALPRGNLSAITSGMEAQITMPWDQPPPEFKEVERRGFNDGVQAAIKDFNHHREPEPERHKEFREPHVHRSFVGDYRKGFQRGYDDAMGHMIRSKGEHS
ncbi:MAG TPA: hypothetical protein VGL00_15095 [Terracidiphilus sp.]|jgi:hypothetical protein